MDSITFFRCATARNVSVVVYGPDSMNACKVLVEENASLILIFGGGSHFLASPSYFDRVVVFSRISESVRVPQISRFPSISAKL